MNAVGFAHGFVEECGDDAAVRVSGRAGKTAGQTYKADNLLLFIYLKAQA